MKSAYAWLGRLLYRLALPFSVVWFNTFGKRRSRVLVRNQKGQLLLVKSWFGLQYWSLPGGGIKRSESLTAAAARELHEETGLKDVKDLQLVDQTWMGEASLRYMAFIFTAKVNEMHIPGPLPRFRHEILELKWFNVGELPTNVKQRYGDYV